MTSAPISASTDDAKVAAGLARLMSNTTTPSRGPFLNLALSTSKYCFETSCHSIGITT
ncbi:hypothetical protein [Geoglobus ahangari]|uniref:hypothetical protein n=1 Tax=Geoglobus ahangari TaxID=113653 RepID=UPI0014703B6E|nr:hypothetical protein [Geoglobus ahangari]